MAEHGPTDFGRFFLEQEPRAAFFNAIRPFGTSPNRQRFFENQFDPFKNRYFGALGGFFQGGGEFSDAPTFMDFLGDEDFNQTFFRASPPQRGEFGGGVNPRTRWLTRGF